MELIVMGVTAIGTNVMELIVMRVTAMRTNAMELIEMGVLTSGVVVMAGSVFGGTV